MVFRSINDRFSPKCSMCGIKNICVSAGLSATETASLDSVITGTKKIAKGDKLFLKSDPFKNLYAIRIGSFKSSLSSRDGTEQVTGFYMAGEVLGLGGITSGCHFCDMTAMEDSEVCVLPFKKFEELAQDIHQLNRNLLRFLCSEYVRGQKNMLFLGSMRSEEKVASFLLDLSLRYEARGYSRTEFLLRMTRTEIGSLLGIKPETVSRVFSKFADNNLIEIQQKRIHILDLTGLKAVTTEGNRPD